MAYQPRTLRALGAETIGDWRMKTYAIAPLGDSARPALIAATISLLPETLPSEPFAEGRHGVGFTIAHDAAGICFGLIYWWQGENELHQRLFMSPKHAPADLHPIEHPAAGCVWELGIIDFERRAWLADVLANPAGPDVHLYMSRALNTEF